jgi:hypothetical protein
MGLVWLVLSKWVLLGCGSVTVRLRDVIEIVIRGDEVAICLLEYLRHRVNHYFLRVKPEIELNVGVEIKGTSRTKMKKARHVSPPIVPMEAAPTLRFPSLFYSVIFFLT